MIFEVILYLLASYLMGSIPFSLIIAKFFYNIDIQNSGSRNVGATNVLRTCDRKGAAIAMLCDGLKGFIIILLGKYFFRDHHFVILLGGFFAIIGHIYSIWLNFSGGKGVATAAFVLCAHDGRLGVVFVLSWVISFLLTGAGYSSAASIIAVITSCAVGILFTNNCTLCYMLIMILLVYKHRNNIEALWNNQERKVDLFKRGQEKELQ